jgi:Domain of unknown function (DUF4388)
MTETKSLQGSFEADSLPLMIQYLAVSNREGRLTLRSDNRTAKVVYLDGNIVAASCDKVAGEPAVAELLAFTHGQFEFVQTPIKLESLPPAMRINKPLSALLLSAAVERDTLDTRERESQRPVQNVITLETVPIIQPPKPGVSVQLDKAAWLIMPKMDGKRTVGEIAKELQLEDYVVITHLESMLANGLIQVTERVAGVPEGLIAEIKKVVVQLTGPMGSFLLEEIAEDLSSDLLNLPMASLQEFLTRTQAQIPPERQVAYANGINQVLKQFKLI